MLPGTRILIFCWCYFAPGLLRIPKVRCGFWTWRWEPFFTHLLSGLMDCSFSHKPVGGRAKGGGAQWPSLFYFAQWLIIEMIWLVVVVVVCNKRKVCFVGKGVFVYCFVLLWGPVCLLFTCNTAVFERILVLHIMWQGTRKKVIFFMHQKQTAIQLLFFKLSHNHRNRSKPRTNIQ